MYVVYCSQQLDGIAAAAILFRAARLTGHEVRLGGILNFENADEQFSAMQNLSGDLIFILDFLPDNIQAFEQKLSAITVRNRIAYWNSHHPHSEADGAILSRHAHTVDLSGPLHYAPVPKEKTCAAEIAQKKFLPNDSVARELAKIAHDIEFWERTDNRAVQLADLIASGFEPKELVDILSRGILWSERFEQLRQEYLGKKQHAMQDIIAHLAVRNILGYNFGFSLAQSILPSSDAGQHILDTHSGVDVSVVLYRNGRISFRKRDTCNLNLAEIAKLFGGGGHNYAAGARLAQHQSITRENFDNVLFELDQQLKTHLLR
ncbi:MAG: DHHA1 domain-containing protein [Candidatus Woesearchaeota archaeon]